MLTTVSLRSELLMWTRRHWGILNIHISDVKHGLAHLTRKQSSTIHLQIKWKNTRKLPNDPSTLEALLTIQDINTAGSSGQWLRGQKVKCSVAPAQRDIFITPRHAWRDKHQSSERNKTLLSSHQCWNIMQSVTHYCEGNPESTGVRFHPQRVCSVITSDWLYRSPLTNLKRTRGRQTINDVLGDPNAPETALFLDI